MGNRLYWVRAYETDDDAANECLADKSQSQLIYDLLEVYFEMDSPPKGGGYFYNKHKWIELNRILPMEIDEGGFKYPSVYFHTVKKKNVHDKSDIQTMSRKDFMDIRPIIKRISDDVRDAVLI